MDSCILRSVIAVLHCGETDCEAQPLEIDFLERDGLVHKQRMELAEELRRTRWVVLSHPRLVHIAQVEDMWAAALFVVFQP